MNQYVTRTIIKELRERNKMTQLQLADKLEKAIRILRCWSQLQTLFPYLSQN